MGINSFCFISVAVVSVLSNSLAIRDKEVTKSINGTLIIVSEAIGDLFNKITKLNDANFDEFKDKILADFETVQRGTTQVNTDLVLLLQVPDLTENLQTAIKSVQQDLENLENFLPSLIKQLETTSSKTTLKNILDQNITPVTQGFLALFKLYSAILLAGKGTEYEIQPTLDLLDVSLKPIMETLLTGSGKLEEFFNLLTPEITDNIYHVVTKASERLIRGKLWDVYYNLKEKGALPLNLDVQQIGEMPYAM